MKKFPFYKQADQMDCGPACLRMISKFYGKNFTLQRLRDTSGLSREGVSLLGISEAAEKIGFRTTAAKIRLEQLKRLDLPAILHWNQSHFVVLSSIRNNRYHIADPAKGIILYKEHEFSENWIGNSTGISGQGIMLAFEGQSCVL